jgi:hypothetical protein
MTFVELPIIADNDSTILVWVNWDNVVGVLDFEGKVRVSTTNSAEAATVDLDTTAIDLIEAVTRHPESRFVALNEIRWRLKN